jgi:hypothetical protein
VSAEERSDRSESDPRHYEPPRVVDLGTVSEVTRGAHLGSAHDLIAVSL